MKLKFVRVGLIALMITASVKALAADAILSVDGDLMIHPNQLSSFFTLAEKSVQSSTNWTWTDLAFSQPYKTQWTNVVAQGPFAITFDGSNLKNNELSFTMNWASPKISVGGFTIHDTLTRVVSGVNLIFHLDGSCSNMNLSIPNANWNIKGTMRWDYQAQGFVVSWQNFAFQGNSAAVPAIDLGQCTSPAGLNVELIKSFNAVLSDSTWLGNIFQQGLQNWMQTSLVEMQSELMAPRSLKVNSDLNAMWTPANLSALPGGLMRVAGSFALSKSGSTVGAAHVVRNYSPSILKSVGQSGFVLPSGTLPAVVKYLYSNGELQYRVNSSSVSAFKSLMSNSVEQFFVWPDLANFAQDTNFIFDLTTSAAPTLGQGYMLSGGGSAYSLSAPIVAHQWAPNPRGGALLPYIDFTSAMNGQVRAKISGGKLNLSMSTTDMNLNAAFRKEFAATRSVNNWIATSMIAPELQSFINSQSYSVAVPAWPIGQGMTLQMSDIQAYQQSFRIPLDFAAAP